MEIKASQPSEITRRNLGRRPGFEIDGAILKELRERLGFDRTELHKRVSGKTVISDDSRRRVFSRWESEGLIKDRKTAEHLANALGTTIAVLQGGAPEAGPDRVKDLTKQLIQQANAGNALAQAELANAVGEETSIEKVAQRLATRVELAQLTRQVSKLEELSLISGWTLRELERPANLHGYWLIASEHTLGNSTSQIVLGIDAMISNVQQEVKSWLQSANSEHPTLLPHDARLVFREEAPWYRVQVEHPTRAWTNRTLSIVRCEPGETGLKWARPSRYDRCRIKKLPLEFWSYSNFIEGLAAGPALQNLRQLRLIIERRRPKLLLKAFNEGKPEPLPEIAAVVDGILDELENDRLLEFAKDGASHFIVLNRIAQGLWTALEKDMAHWPRECWAVRRFQSAFSIELETSPFLAIHQLGRRPRAECRYVVKVVEMLENGSLRDRPWRSDGVADVMKIFESHMQNLPTAPPKSHFFVGPPVPENWPDPDN